MPEMAMQVAVTLCWVFFAANVLAASPSPDTSALQAFQASADPSLLVLNWTGGEPCNANWIGVLCDDGGNVRELVLEGLHLAGPITVLANLSQLRLLSLKDNAFNGSLPDMKQWRSLRHLYLHNNKLSGPIPESIGALTRLLRFTASSNQLTGPIPLAITKLTHLATLRLENNQLSGLIPPIQLVNLSDFNISHNQFAGSIPASLDKFGASAFQGNPMLCGRPLFPTMVCNGTNPTTVPSTQSTDPGVGSIEKIKKPGLRTGAIIAIVLGDAAVFLLISILSATYYWRKYPHRHAHEKTPKKMEETGDLVMTQYAPTSKASESGERCKLVFFEHSSQFELGDLLRASAEMLGKGSFGTAYKAVLENGRIVAVKRMKEVNASTKKDFEQKMETIGKLWHPNVLPLRAYYFAKEEKLLVYDYEPNGSLHSLLHGKIELISLEPALNLHTVLMMIQTCANKLKISLSHFVSALLAGNRGPGRTPLDWATRLKIALGVAKALRYLHDEYGKQKIAHGNIKSSNILLDENHHPLVADFGLALIMNPTAASSRVAGYRAPEHADSKRISQAADVYSFGVVRLLSSFCIFLFLFLGM